MVCSCCNRQKIELHSKKSRLIPAMTLYMCNDCIKAKREPRFVIILAAKAAEGGNFDAIRDYIRQRRYIGDEIRGSEIV